MPANAAAETERLDTSSDAGPSSPSWYALHTHSHCEDLVHQQLVAKGLDVFLPKLDVWSRRAGVRTVIRRPLFPGYLFLREAMDKYCYTEVRKARGLVRVLGERWDRLAVIPPSEMEAIQRLVQSRLPALPHPFLREGCRVRITRGPLADVEGILLRVRPNKGLLVLSLDLLQRSLAVEIDCSFVVPV